MDKMAFISMKIDQPDRMEALRHFVNELAIIKRVSTVPNAELLLDRCLDEKARNYFSMLSPEEWDEWKKEWFSTPVDERLRNSALQPHWDKSSFIEALIQGEFLVGDLQIVGDEARFTFNPLAYPYGGSNCLVAIVEAFGQTVVGIDDGTGYQTYKKRESWKPKAKRR